MMLNGRSMEPILGTDRVCLGKRIQRDDPTLPSLQPPHGDICSAQTERDARNAVTPDAREGDGGSDDIRARNGTAEGLADTNSQDDAIDTTAKAIYRADKILILAGAGWSAGSLKADGTPLPDYRSKGMFAFHYGPLADQGLDYQTLASAACFAKRPQEAWGFYASRMRMYGQSKPHRGYTALLRLIETKDYFVFTSNVDGLFEKANYDRMKIVECHGTLSKVQCLQSQRHGVWGSSKVAKDVEVDESFKASPDTFPYCKAFRCSSLARPNVLLFGDTQFHATRTEKQLARFKQWADATPGKRLAIIEIGAGTAVRTIRDMTRTMYLDAFSNISQHGGSVDAIRINSTPDSMAETRRCGGLCLAAHVVMNAEPAMMSIKKAVEQLQQNLEVIQYK